MPVNISGCTCSNYEHFSGFCCAYCGSPHVLFCHLWWHDISEYVYAWRFVEMSKSFAVMIWMFRAAIFLVLPKRSNKKKRKKKEQTLYSSRYLRRTAGRIAVVLIPMYRFPLCVWCGPTAGPQNRAEFLRWSVQLGQEHDMEGGMCDGVVCVCVSREKEGNLRHFRDRKIFLKPQLVF